MKIRQNLFPNTTADVVAVLFLFCLIPVTFWFEVMIVIPEVHGADSVYRWLHMVPAVFLLFNVIAHMLATMLCDTSSASEMIKMPRNPDKFSGTGSGWWHLCASCECVAPPRAWHCPTCDTCILKRDHHCLFTGCCIGHKNQRYFILFVAYMFIATLYTSVLNNYFIWVVRAAEFRSWGTVVKLIFPFAMVLFDSTTKQYYLLIYLINMVGLLFTGVLLVYHSRIMFQGAVIHEPMIPEYDMGLKENIRMVLGNRWYVAWISPFIKSEQPHNGVNWETILSNAYKKK